MPRRIPIIEYKCNPPRRVIKSFDELPAVMDTAAAAIALGVGIETVKKLLQKKKLVGFKVGSNWRIKKERLEEFIERLESA